MGRARIPITWIKSDASRQVTYTKRRKGLKKKIEELAILCGVEACMICYGPQLGKPSSVPFSWGLPGVSQVISKYQSLSKEEQDKKKLDNKSLLEQQIKKLKLELRLRVEQNQKLEREQAYSLWDDRLNCYGLEDVKCLADYLAGKIRVTYDRMTHLTTYHVHAADPDRLGLAVPSTLNSQNNMFLAEGQSGGEYDFMSQTSSVFPRENVPRNLFRQVVSSLPSAHNQCSSPACLGPQQAYDLPVQSSEEVYAIITMPDISTEITNLNTRTSHGELPSDVHDQMITISTDHVQTQQLRLKSTRKPLQPQNMQYGYVASRSSAFLSTTVTASDILSPSTSQKELNFSTVPSEWPRPDPIIVPQSSVMQMEDESTHKTSEPLHIDMQASLNERGSNLNQQE
ncbi:hypothetical protein O6H91_11G005600 [Diphasiastrum complanatum]|uniref:Uncharacterized protein n=1 Tax=Diphasiastrum complanatum TaxID=34168 RepID=A0ACC2C5X3_DIPCM|nr:hypothetical protein O6H91_Y437300 [Diphasiastrum complanatum]KAJ7296268.1 hypothetical protein O6H91_Y134200 [Diphasiastrum complanatum]KAJ7537431.1 hypothetical protein O6H91_11G005600 [Diphasiastrum complanatum]